MFEMNDAIRTAITNNLPAAVAGELATFIKQAESTAQQLVSLREESKRQVITIEQLREQVRAQADLDAREAALASGRANLTEQELALTSREAANQAVVATAAMNAMRETMGMFLKLPQVRTQILAEVGVPVSGAPGGNGMAGYGGTVMRSNDTQTTTVSQE